MLYVFLKGGEDNYIVTAIILFIDLIYTHSILQ